MIQGPLFVIRSYIDSEAGTYLPSFEYAKAAVGKRVYNCLNILGGASVWNKDP